MGPVVVIEMEVVRDKRSDKLTHIQRGVQFTSSWIWYVVVKVIARLPGIGVPSTYQNMLVRQPVRMSGSTKMQELCV